MQIFYYIKNLFYKGKFYYNFYIYIKITPSFKFLYYFIISYNSLQLLLIFFVILIEPSRIQLFYFLFIPERTFLNICLKKYELFYQKHSSTRYKDFLTQKDIKLFSLTFKNNRKIRINLN
jgi:hypothetical protein